MPLRITPDKLLLIYYDADTDSWITREGLSISLLSQFVEVQPGVTVEDVFHLIDADPSVKAFLSEYCACDIDEIRKLPPLRTDRPIEVPTAVQWENGRGRVTDKAVIDTVVIHPCFFAYADETTGQRRLDASYLLGGRSSKNDQSVIGFGDANPVTYADIKDCLLKLDPTIHIEECGSEQPIDGDVASSTFTADTRYTLLDVLSTLVRQFGTEAIDSRYQPDIDYERALQERFERDSAAPDDELDQADS